ncbi:MAG: hypothetical protein AB9846_16435 [Tenuifilaceae bacterium]
MKKSQLIIIALFLGMVQTHCERDVNNSSVTGQLVSNTICKNQMLTKNQNSFVENNQSCIRYVYVESTQTLRITHENSGFNCCPGELSVNIKIDGNTITIEELEELPECHCLCLYDLEIEVYNVKPLQYLLIIQEPYIGENEPLSFIIDINDNPTGAFCVTRNNYPWGL